VVDTSPDLVSHRDGVLGSE